MWTGGSLFLFKERLELYSPGKLPNGITMEQMPYRTFTRNQLLVSFPSKMRSKRTGRVFLESRGEGVRKILEGGEAQSGRRPEYELFGNEFAVDGLGEGDREWKSGEQEVALRVPPCNATPQSPQVTADHRTKATGVVPAPIGLAQSLTLSPLL